MSDQLPPPPAKARASLPSSANKTKMKLDAYTDWFIVAAATLLTAIDKMPYEAALGLFIGVAGLASYARKAGVGGGTATGLLLLFSKKLLIGIGLSAALFGCTAAQIQQGGTTALKILAPMFAQSLRDAAKEKKVTLDEAAAFCEPIDMSYGDFDMPGVVVVCWAPEVE